MMCKKTVLGAIILIFAFRANAFELKKPNKAACQSPELSLSLPVKSRSIALLECEKYLKAYTEIYTKLDKLRQLNTLSDIQLASEMDENFRAELREINNHFFKIYELRSSHIDPKISQPLSAGLNLDAGYVKDLHENALKLLDKTYNKVLNHKIKMEEKIQPQLIAKDVGLFTSAYAKLYYHPDRRDLMLRSNYVMADYCCKYDRCLIEEADKQKDCQYADNKRDKYLEIKLSDQNEQNKTKASSANKPNQPGQKVNRNAEGN